MPIGRCAGCGDETCLPPFGEGLCFLCATDGPPGSVQTTGGAVSEDVDARRQAWPVSDQEVDRMREVLDLFAEAQAREAQPGSFANASLGGDYKFQFCFSTQPNAPTKARWINRRHRAAPETEEQAERRRKRERAQKPSQPRQVRIDPASGLIVFGCQRSVERRVFVPKIKHGRGRPQIAGSLLQRCVSYVCAHPGCTDKEIATAFGLGHRVVCHRLTTAKEHQRVQRVGTHGHSRWYPGPRAIPDVTLEPEKMAHLQASISESALHRLETGARAAGKDLGAYIETLLGRGTEAELPDKTVGDAK